MTVPVTTPDGPSNAPGDISGVSIEQDVGETLTVRKKQRRGFPPPTTSDWLELQSFPDWKVF